MGKHEECDNEECNNNVNNDNNIIDHDEEKKIRTKSLHFIRPTVEFLIFILSCIDAQCQSRASQDFLNITQKTQSFDLTQILEPMDACVSTES